MSEQNKTKNVYRKVNKKPGTAPAVIIAVVVSVFVVFMAVLFSGGCALFSERINPNHGIVDDFVDYFTDEYGNKYYTSQNEHGDSVIVDNIHKNQSFHLIL